MRPAALALTLAGGLAYVVGALVWLGHEQRRDTTTFAPGSVYNTSPEGCALAFRYLRETAAGGQKGVRVLSRPFGVAALDADAVVLRLRPRLAQRALTERHHVEGDDQEPDDKATGSPTPPPKPARLLGPEEEEWVRGGGRLVLGLDADYGPIGLGAGPVGREARELTKVFPVWPEVRRLEPTVARGLARGAPDGSHALFALGQQAALVRWPLGRGEVFVLAAPEILSNAHLAHADHLRLLQALAGSGRPVFFDEHAHGLGRQDGLLELMLAWGLGPALILLAASFALMLWRSHVRLGPAEEDPAPVRTDAVDLVDSLAQLYDRVLTRREVTERYLASLERAVALRTGLAGRALTRRVEELLGGARPRLAPDRELGPAELARFLSSINAGFGRLSEHVSSGRRH